MPPIKRPSSPVLGGPPKKKQKPSKKVEDLLETLDSVLRKDAKLASGKRPVTKTNLVDGHGKLEITASTFPKYFHLKPAELNELCKDADFLQEIRDGIGDDEWSLLIGRQTTRSIKQQQGAETKAVKLHKTIKTKSLGIWRQGMKEKQRAKDVRAALNEELKTRKARDTAAVQNLGGSESTQSTFGEIIAAAAIQDSNAETDEENKQKITDIEAQLARLDDTETPKWEGLPDETALGPVRPEESKSHIEDFQGADTRLAKYGISLPQCWGWDCHPTDAAPELTHLVNGLDMLKKFSVGAMTQNITKHLKEICQIAGLDREIEELHQSDTLSADQKIELEFAELAHMARVLDDPSSLRKKLAKFSMATRTAKSMAIYNNHEDKNAAYHKLCRKQYGDQAFDSLMAEKKAGNAAASKKLQGWVQYWKGLARFGRLVQLIVDAIGFPGLLALNPDHPISTYQLMPLLTMKVFVEGIKNNTEITKRAALLCQHASEPLQDFITGKISGAKGFPAILAKVESAFGP